MVAGYSGSAPATDSFSLTADTQRWRLHSQGFVRTHLVVFLAKAMQLFAAAAVGRPAAVPLSFSTSDA